jgi:hypothetical protein
MDEHFGKLISIRPRSSVSPTEISIDPLSTCRMVRVVRDVHCKFLHGGNVAFDQIEP